MVIPGMALIALIEKGDRELLVKKLEDIKGQNSSKELLERTQHGHTPVDLAALLGKKELLELLLEHGAEVNSANKSGYTAMHYSAAWGQLTCLLVLADKGADCLTRTRYKETPKAMAVRYGHPQCVEFLNNLEQCRELEQAVSSTRLTLSDSDKIAGKWNKEDKSKVTALCNEKSDWLERKQKESTFEEIQLQNKDFETRMEPFLTKLAT